MGPTNIFNFIMFTKAQTVECRKRKQIYINGPNPTKGPMNLLELTKPLTQSINKSHNLHLYF